MTNVGLNAALPAAPVKLATTSRALVATPGGTAAAASSSEQDVGLALAQMNQLTQSIRRELQFTVDDESGRTVITVIDAETQEIVRQIPAEQAAQVVDSLGNVTAGLIRGIKA